MQERRSSRDHGGLANERRPKPQAYPLVTIGAGALPLPTKQPPKLSAVTTKASANATFFIDFPFFSGSLWLVSDESQLFSNRRPAASSRQKEPNRH